jgi:hypothetical protein
MEFEIISMNDKSSIPAPQGGTPGSSQSVVWEKGAILEKYNKQRDEFWEGVNKRNNEVLSALPEQEVGDWEDKLNEFWRFKKQTRTVISLSNWKSFIRTAIETAVKNREREIAVETTTQPQATQEKCSIHGGIKTKNLNSVYCCKKAIQEKPDERQYREDVEAGVDMSTPTEVSQTWEEDYVMAGLLRNEFRIWDEKVATNWHINHEAIQAFISKKIAQAKRQEGERILEEMKKQYAPPLYTNDGRRGYDSCLSDLTNIINNHD